MKYVILSFFFSFSFHSHALPSSHESVADYKSRIKSRFKGEPLKIIFSSKSLKVNGPNANNAWYLKSQTRYSGVFGVGWKKAWSKGGKILTTVWIRKSGDNYLFDGPNLLDGQELILIKNKKKRLGQRIKNFITRKKEKQLSLLISGALETWYKAARAKKSISVNLGDVEKHGNLDGLIKVFPSGKSEVYKYGQPVF